MTNLYNILLEKNAPGMIRVATVRSAMQNAHTLNIEPVSKDKHSEWSRPLEGRVEGEKRENGAGNSEQKKIIPAGSIAVTSNTNNFYIDIGPSAGTPGFTCSEYSTSGTPNPGFWATDTIVQRITPEPSTLLLLGSGLVGLVGWRWRRK
jgi:hypothetical protein